MEINNDIEILLIKFWEEGVWNSNINNIYNDKIKKVLCELKILNNRNNNNSRFNISNFNIENDSNSILDNNINEIKKNNINYFKTHAECIPEYHMLVINYKNNYQKLN